jgi:hypothetical protein
MWHILLLVAGAHAFFNESCNALHLAEICEDECNTDLNICISSAGGNYDLIHNCLRDHENCFQVKKICFTKIPDKSDSVIPEIIK